MADGIGMKRCYLWLGSRDLFPIYSHLNQERRYLLPRDISEGGREEVDGGGSANIKRERKSQWAEERNNGAEEQKKKSQWRSILEM